MEFLILILGGILCVFCYLAFGMIVRWIWEWWVLAISTPILFTIGMKSGLGGAAVCLCIFCVALVANNSWHTTDLYFRGAKWIDKAFYFRDV